ncbi:MAG: hypothetical protein ACMXYC_02230 [Candidatus Woesearchaeota archaeon]
MINPYIILIIGAIVTFVSWINPDVRSRLVLFFFIGIAMMVFAGIRLFVFHMSKPKKSTQTKQTQHTHKQHHTVTQPKVDFAVRCPHCNKFTSGALPRCMFCGGTLPKR